MSEGVSEGESGEPRPPHPHPQRRIAAALLVALVLGALALVLWGSLEISERPYDTDPGYGANAPPAGREPESLLGGTTTDTLSITSYNAVAARASTDTVGIFEGPLAPEPASRLPRTNEHGAPQTFLVIEVQKGWAKVMLPTPPNGSTGWIKTSEVEFYGIAHVVRVRLASKRLEVWESGRLALSLPAGIGRKNTPTPAGAYYIKELLKPEDPSGPWGTYAYGLNGYSNTVYGPEGGPGVIGIHGTNEPDSVGKEVSAGCIRLRNEDVGRLVDILPLGTPVEIIED